MMLYEYESFWSFLKWFCCHVWCKCSRCFHLSSRNVEELNVWKQHAQAVEADCRREHLRSGELKPGGVSACQKCAVKNVLWRDADKCSALLFFFFRKSAFLQSFEEDKKKITFDCHKKSEAQLSVCCRREASSIFNVFSPGIAWTLPPKSSGNCGGFLKWGYPMVPPNQSKSVILIKDFPL